MRLARPAKGRWFVGVVLATLAGLASYEVWHSLFRYSGYGVVDGHVVNVAPAWAGVIEHMYVREGDYVAKGQVLFTQRNVPLRQRRARLGDELRVAEATLAAAGAEARLQEQLALERGQRATADDFEAWGRLLNERAKLALAFNRLQRSSALAGTNAISADRADADRFVESGLRQQVAKLEETVNSCGNVRSWGSRRPRTP